MKKIFLLLIVIAFYGCNDYLDIEEKGKVIPESVEDLNLLMADYTKFIVVLSMYSLQMMR